MRKLIASLLIFVSMSFAFIPASGKTVTKDGIVYENRGDSITVVGFDAIGNTLSIPETIDGLPVTEIGAQAFRGSKAIITAKIPSSVKVIGEGAFEACESLTSVEIQDGLTVIPASTFRGCEHLKSIQLPSTLKIIEGNAFYGCIRLGKVEIPSSLEKIEDYAFMGCESLTFKLNGNIAAEEYALQNSIPTKFTQTRTYRFILIIAATAALGGAVYGISLISKKIAARKKPDIRR